MSFHKICGVFALAVLPCISVFGQSTEIKFVTNMTIGNELDGNFVPLVGVPYTFVPGIGQENPIDGTSLGYTFGVDIDPETGTVNDAIMDGLPDVIGMDFVEALGVGTSSPIIVREQLECLGPHPFYPGFMLVITLTIEATGTELIWDSLDQDLLDPTDFDSDMDFNEPDGILDTGDGIPDQPFPLDPIGLTVQIDLDRDGDPENDPPANSVRVGAFLGENAGGTPVQIGPPQPFAESVVWDLRDFHGEVVDLDRDGRPDGPFDAECSWICNGGQFGMEWSGSYGIGFLNDNNPATTNELMSGTMKSMSLTFYLRSENPFEIEPIVIAGDVNFDRTVDLLDIKPFVDLITANLYRPEADINQDGVVGLLDVAPFVELLIDD